MTKKSEVSFLPTVGDEVKITAIKSFGYVAGLKVGDVITVSESSDGGRYKDEDGFIWLQAESLANGQRRRGWVRCELLEEAKAFTAPAGNPQNPSNSCHLCSDGFGLTDIDRIVVDDGVYAHKTCLERSRTLRARENDDKVIAHWEANHPDAAEVLRDLVRRKLYTEERARTQEAREVAMRVVQDRRTKAQ